MKTERLDLRITPELKAQLAAAAEAEGRSLTNYILYVLTENLKKQESR